MEPVALRETDTGAARRSLRDERDQLLRWRRLVRARLDLAVARFAPPRPLGTLSWALLPAVSDLPEAHRFEEVLDLATGEDPIELMRRLRMLDQELARYGVHLDAALDEQTQRLLEQIAHLPGVHQP